MNMRDHVSGFVNQMKEAQLIAQKFKAPKTPPIHNVLICGLGGSGIGGGITRDLLRDECPVPIDLCNTYDIPAYVNEGTLCICCSYSGNTEETLEAMKKAKKKGAFIQVITSGGKMMAFAKKNDIPFIEVPGGMPPRAALGYSLTDLLYVFHAYKLSSDKPIKQLKKTIPFLESSQKSIKSKAKSLAKKIYEKIPIIYIGDGMEGIAIRWRQQINENGKQIVSHHKVPEMNHNELVGWASKQDAVAVLFISTKSEHKRISLRNELNKKVIKQYSDVYTINAEGKNKVEESFYLINFGDWLSVDIADLRDVDAMEIDVINNLKAALSKK